MSNEEKVAAFQKMTAMMVELQVLRAELEERGKALAQMTREMDALNTVASNRIAAIKIEIDRIKADSGLKD